MNVQEVTLTSFMSTEKSVLELPAKGVVVVTGPNGSGKSTIYEGVAMAAWGKTVRGAKPWGKKLSVARTVVKTRDGLTVNRTPSTFKWGHESDPKTVTYETRGKSQAALESVVGDFSTWKRTSVFAAVETSRFTTATDADRKVLLESILGLDVLARAHDFAKGQLKKLSLQVDMCQADFHIIDVKRSKLEGQVESAQAEKGRLLEELASLSNEGADKEETLRQAVEDLTDEIARWDARLVEAARVEKAALAAGVKAQANVKAVEKARECAACGQPLTDHVLAVMKAQKAADEVTFKQNKAVANKCKVDVAYSLALDYPKGLRAQLVAAKAAYEQGAGAAIAYKRCETALEGASKRLDALLKQQTGLDDEWQAVSEKLEATKAKVATQKVVVDVLGTRGVRAHVLGRALAGLETTANRYLTAVAGPGVSVKLSASTETKSGEARDKIGLDIIGFANGEGYKAASIGERTRVDVAFLFALADVASAAAGREPGTMFVDECFDGLDDEGRESVVEVVQTISKSRCVVVITHNQDLARSIPGARHIRMTSQGRAIG